MFLEQFPMEGRANGWIEVICGSMFSGKTEELIRRIRRAEFANQALLLFKPKIDNRFSEKNVVSHKGNTFEAVIVEHANDILSQWQNEQVVAIDEAQFFDASIVDVCNELANKGVRVIIAGLDMDYQGTAFGQTAIRRSRMQEQRGLCLDRTRSGRRCRERGHNAQEVLARLARSSALTRCDGRRDIRGWPLCL